MPIWKGTEVSLSYVQCFLYLVSSSINVSVFHIAWLGIFWTDRVCIAHRHRQQCGEGQGGGKAGAGWRRLVKLRDGGIRDLYNVSTIKK